MGCAAPRAHPEGRRPQREDTQGPGGRPRRRKPSKGPLGPAAGACPPGRSPPAEPPGGEPRRRPRQGPQGTGGPPAGVGDHR